MRLEIFYLTTLSSIAQAQWSYRLLYTPVSRNVILWNTKPISEYPKPCANLCQRYAVRNPKKRGPGDSKPRALAGIAIHQPTPTDNLKNPVIAKYIGFWASYHCKSLPRYVIHFKPDLNTIQEVTFQQFDLFIPGFNASDFSIWAWGEVPQGDEIFGSIPPGGVAFRESGAHPWIGNYIVAENMVAAGPRSVVHGQIRAVPGVRPSHWHIDVGKENRARLTRPKDGVVQPLLGEIVTDRYYGPIPPEYVRRYHGDEITANLGESNGNQGGERIGRMEEEQRLPPVPAYDMDEQKRAILKAYVQIHGAESALFSLRQMIDEYRFQHYMGLLTPELQEAAKRNGLMQLQVGERADRLAEKQIQREAIQLPEEDRKAFILKGRADLQLEKDTGRTMILFLVKEIQGLVDDPKDVTEEVQPGDNQLEEIDRNLRQGGEQQEIGLLQPGVENNDDELESKVECEAEPPIAVQNLPESNSPPYLDFRPVANSEIERLSERLLNQNNRVTVNLESNTEIETKAAKELSMEYSKPEAEVQEDTLEQALDQIQGDQFIDPELQNVIDSEVENIVKSEYGELLRSEGLEDRQGDVLNLGDLPPSDAIFEEPLNQISEESLNQIPSNRMVEEFQNQALEEAEIQNPERAPVNMVGGIGNNIGPLQQNQLLEQNSGSEQQIPLGQVEVDSDDEPRFASSFGRNRYRNEAQREDSPRTARHMTTHGRMSFRDWLSSRSNELEAATQLIDLGIIPNVNQENGNQGTE
ncbi:hypothetical protein TWF506_010610 [Arthrobotrys conoides]|uniref:Uncharacterized protein n=1 Tax=Arthrobotrys conoides TaxID=74498 RepID=A0AAN8N1W4_9PEZI